MAELEFRTDEIERRDIRTRNHEKTQAILDAAEIQKDNPNYKRYYNATMINVHNAYRFSYNGETDLQIEKVLDSFTETIKDPNVTIEQYEAGTKTFLHTRAVKQLGSADGQFAKATTYEEMRSTLNTTIQSGMEMRQEQETTFPKEFYTEKGSLRRIIVDIPLELQTESAMRNIDMVVAKYKDKGIEFNSEENAFFVKGQKVGPEVFFTSKRDRLQSFLTKYEANPEILDTKDSALLDVIGEGNYEKFIELAKQRGIERDKTNEALRTALKDKDEVAFGEVSASLRLKDGKLEDNLVTSIQEISSQFAQSGALVRKESEKDVLGRVDRVMFSVVPEDVATQSTFRNWKSCMHTSGVNHEYVDDSIGLGSIVAYGYDSQNPQKMVTRLLIHPYQDEDGNIAYKVNDRIYGKENTGFRKTVEKVTEHFNKGIKEGTYHISHKLYDDNHTGSSFTFITEEKDGTIDLSHLQDERHHIEVSGNDFSQKKQVIAPAQSNIIFNRVTLPDNTDLSAANYVCFETCKVNSSIKTPKDTTFEGSTISGDVAKFKDAVFDGCIFENAVVPDNIKLQGISVKFIDTDVPDCDYSKLSMISIKGNSKIGENFKAESATVSLTDMNIENIDLSQNMEITLCGRTKVGQNVIFPKDKQFYNAVINYDISHLDDIKLNNCILEKGCEFSPKAKIHNQVICKDSEVLDKLLKADTSGLNMVAVTDNVALPADFDKTNKMWFIVDDKISDIDNLNMETIKKVIVADEETKQAITQEGFDGTRIFTYDEYKKAFSSKIKSAQKQESQEKPIQQDKKQEKTATTPSKDDKARLAELSGRTGPAKPTAKAQDDAAKTQDTPTKTQDGKAEIRPDAELKFATPMQTSDLPPAPVVVQAPSQDEYDKFASQNADSKLRKLCEDLRGKDEKLYTQVVTEWNRQYSANPPKDMAQGDQIAQNVMMQYKKDLEPLVIDQIQKDITPQNSANVDATKLDQAKDDLQQKDPTARAEVVAELNKQAEAVTPQQQTTEAAPKVTEPTTQTQTAFKEQPMQKQGADIRKMREQGRNVHLEQSPDYIPNPITAPTRTAPQPQQTNTAAFNLAQATKTADTSRGSY